MDTSLKQQVAVVTGAGRGIGKAIAIALAREGASVAAIDINSEGATTTATEIRQVGGEAVGLAADVARNEDVACIMQSVAELYGRLDILVNVAGLISNTPVLELAEEEWDRVLAVNLKGIFLCCKHAAGLMVRQGSGRIINISSLAGIVGAPGQAAYCASKHGVLGFTKVLAIELGLHGVTVNAICPGNTETEMMLTVFRKRAASRGQTVEELAEGIIAKTPLGRFGRPEDVAQVVLFLASPAAAYITGQSINVCGGRSINLS